jgi:hypothetical protein
VVNILEPGAQRQGRVLDERHAISVTDADGLVSVLLPESTGSALPPLEVIDG